MADLRMTFIDHFTDLRKRIIYVGLVFVVVLFASLAFISKIYRYLVGPITAAHLQLIVVSPGEVITVYLTVAGFVAIGLTLPFALYHVWRFVKPGLTQVEQRYTLRLLPIAFVMFLAGVAFAWFVIFPTILHFLIQISEQNFRVLLRADAYFSFLSGICLPFGFIFELPIVVVFLTRIGVITPRFLRKVRKYAYLVIVILGVLISPPELISHLSVVLPMIFLYEISIILSVIVQRRKEKTDTVK